MPFQNKFKTDIITTDMSIKKESTMTLENDGIEVISKPRTTGDGYYEACILDPDGNKIEITVVE